MASQWDRGILAKSSWHGLEEVGTMVDGTAMVDAGERTGAWPVALRGEELFTRGGMKANAFGMVASYRDHTDRVVGTVGNHYRATTPAEWRGLVEAACEAGAQPTGAFSLRDGSRVLGTFQVGQANGLRTNLLVVDSFDGSLAMNVGFTTIDVVCANTLAVAFRRDGAKMAKIKHTASAEGKIATLRATIGGAINAGQHVRGMYDAARATRLDRAAAERAFDLLWPRAAAGASKGTIARADNARAEACAALALPINARNEPGTLAHVWNAATWLVDRDVNGAARPARGGADVLDSMLFGSRYRRTEEIMTVIEVIMRDGTVQAMSAPLALAAGVDGRAVGRAVLQEMLDAYETNA